MHQKKNRPIIHRFDFGKTHRWAEQTFRSRFWIIAVYHFTSRVIETQFSALKLHLFFSLFRCVVRFFPTSVLFHDTQLIVVLFSALIALKSTH